jgi:hypothetical protein
MIRRGYLSPTCGECGRTFDLLNADDAAEWEYGHDCEAPEGNTCDGCGKDYPHALTTWQGHDGRGEYCEACLPMVRKANALTCTKDPCPICDADGPAGDPLYVAKGAA